jgi:hypothetical protein
MGERVTKWVFGCPVDGAAMMHWRRIVPKALANGYQVFGARSPKPVGTYQVVAVSETLRRVEVGKFAELQIAFGSQDPLLGGDPRKTSLRNYFLCLFSELALLQSESGDFLTAGVSLGTSVKVMFHWPSFSETERRWWLVDPLDGRGGKGGRYNLDINGVMHDLDNSNDQFEFIRRPIPEAIDDVHSGLAFVHLNTAAVEAELLVLPRVIELLEPGGYLMMDFYGWATVDQQVEIDLLLADHDLVSWELPTLQLVAYKKS